MTLVIVAVVVVLVLVGLCFWQFNKLRKLSINVDEGFAQIEVQLTRRADLIPNLVETVKGYAAHEKSVFDSVTAARAALNSAKSDHSVTDTAAAESQINTAIANVIAVAEAYPDLKASTNFLQLQEELTSTENKVAFARQYYNETVRQVNTAVATAPSMFFAGIANVSKREFYEVPDVSQRQAPDVDLNGAG